jgi:Ras-related protein Rab-2A
VTSAKTAANIEKAFIDTASKIHEKIVSVEIDVSNENEESKLGRAEKRIGILVEAVL